jgi:DNA-binding CsgD family transcriptional regulator
MGQELWLVACGAPTRANAYPIRPGQHLIIGRAEDCDIHVQDAWASRQHAELVYEQDTLTVTDLHSRNGTFVNGKPVRTQQLLVGSVLRIGRVAFDVRMEFDEWSEHDNDEETPGAFERNAHNGARSGVRHLPRRQRQVAELLAEGLTEKQVAARLLISQQTVHDYVKEIHTAWGVQSRAELVACVWAGHGARRFRSGC